MPSAATASASSFYSDFTFGCWREAGGKRELAPVGKAYFGFTDEELRWLDKWVRDHTTNRFGPVREVAPELVLEIAFDGIARSTRHKSGLAMRFPRINRIRTDKAGGRGRHNRQPPQALRPGRAENPTESA